ncbi:MAG: biotin/lipoyl-binding protein, partial [Betaproteobacteria bacterium]
MRLFLSTRRRRVVFTVLVVGIAVGVAGFFLLRKGAPPPAQTVAVEYADLESSVQATGTLLPFRKVDVGAQVTGQLQSLNVELGQHVRKGDLLASIDPTLAKNELLGQDAALEQQSATLDSRKIDLAAAERELARQKTMLPADATTTG